MSRYHRTTYSSIGYPRWTRAVKILIISCCVTFLVQVFSGHSFTELFGLIPWDVTNRGYVWQLVTYIFLHDTGSLLHLVFNMLGLWMFGSELEQVWGTRQFTRFFFICGVGAGVLMVLLFLISGGGAYPRIPTIGASGAIYGILLAFGMLFPDRIIYLLIFPIPAKYLVMILGAIAFYSSLSASGGGIAHVAHLGGMVCGYVYIKSRGLARSRRRRSLSAGFRDWYGNWHRRRLRRKFDVYYNRRHGGGNANGDANDNEKWRRWKN
jgi:membrane associated rhomboid family serine protease